mmetsp:Transcript_1194/g.3075  ORF Transcript_1194/g.3075 Transcript_1194/m.3075 type:complete len:83 (-) Transcript_1194:104-352(-)
MKILREQDRTLQRCHNNFAYTVPGYSTIGTSRSVLGGFELWCTFVPFELSHIAITLCRMSPGSTGCDSCWDRTIWALNVDHA